MLVVYHLGQFYNIVSSQMLTNGFNINNMDDHGRTCLHAAASGG